MSKKTQSSNLLSYVLYAVVCVPLIFGAVTSTKVYQYGGLAHNLRMIIMAALIIAGLVIALIGIIAVHGNMKKTVIGVILFGTIFSGANVYAYGLLNKVHETLEHISTTEQTYQGAIVTMSESKFSDVKELDGKKVGYFDLTSSMENYIIPYSILEDAGIVETTTLMPYEDLGFLINALYEGEVDAIMASVNYVSTFENLPGFEDVGLKTVILEEKEETQIVEITDKSSIEDLQEPFSVLLMGVDTNKPSTSGSLTGNADALFLATVNPINYTVNITSIPRDSYVPIMCYGDKRRDKITHANTGGTECVVSTVANMFDIDIDYYVKINFKGLEDLVNALGGIYVTVDENLYPNGLVEQNGKRYYESGYKWIYIPPGTTEVTGEQALAFARCRKKLNDGATERASNQTMVIDGIIEKLLDLDGVSKIYDILDAMGNNVQTNLTVDQMTSFYKMGIDIVNRAKGLNINDAIIIDYLLVSGYDRRIYHDSMEMLLYNYVPYEGSLEDIKTAIHNNLGLNDYTIHNSFSYYRYEHYAKDQAVYYEYNEEKEAFPLPDLVPDMYGYHIDEAVSWANARGIKYSIVEVTKNHELYNSELTDGFVIKHDQKVNRKTSKVSNITFYAIKKNEVVPPVFDGNFEKIEIEYGSKFTLPEIVVTDSEGNKLDYTVTIKLDDETVEKIDTKKAGKYIITYKVIVDEVEFKMTKTVVVKNDLLQNCETADADGKCAVCKEGFIADGKGGCKPSASPTPSASPSPTPSATPSDVPTSTPTVAPTPTPDSTSSLPDNCASGENGVCTSCNSGYDLSNGACVVHSHSYSETGRVEPQVGVDGSVTYTCGSCGHSYSEKIPALQPPHEHSYSETSRVEPQVGVAGSVTYTCSCGHSYSESIDPLPEPETPSDQNGEGTPAE